jgi:hypothetical protein
MHMKKAQAAMEYLMTYGWAIIIVIIVAAALYAMGLFNPGSTPVATQFTTIGKPSPGAWELLSTGTFTVKLANNAPFAVNVTSASVTAGATTCTNVAINGDTAISAGIDIGQGAKFNVTASCGTPIANSIYNVDIVMSGTNSEGLSFKETGRVTGTVV